MEENRLEKYRLENLPNGWLPTLEELIRADEHPAEADPLHLKYLDERPTVRAYIRRCLALGTEPDDLCAGGQS
jgi:hypothetical protein